MARADCDVAVVGGGVFGCSIALHLRTRFERVTLFEREPRLLARASAVNQARVHNGYHYPRSFLTALRSRVNYPRFIADFRDCVDRRFDAYYAIARHGSKVSADQFALFCRRVGLPLEPAPPEFRALFNADLVEEIFRVEECVFDATRLAARFTADLTAAGVDCRLNTTVSKIVPTTDARLALHYEAAGGAERVTAARVFNCTYSRLNRVLMASQLPVVPLRYELTELPLLRVPAPLTNVSVTVLCGPFFSLTPFPPAGVHSLHHVRYTPHSWWQDGGEAAPVDGDAACRQSPPASRHLHMIKDAQRYVPAIAQCAYVESCWEVKTVLPSREVDDGRPILFKKDHGLPNLTCVLGGKIDNFYDALAELDTVYG